MRRPLDDNGKPKGFCFLDFSKSEEANKALELNETALSGRNITVERSMKSKAVESKNKKIKPNSESSATEEPEDSCTIFVRNVNMDAKDQDLKNFFAKCGTIVY